MGLMRGDPSGRSVPSIATRAAASRAVPSRAISGAPRSRSRQPAVLADEITSATVQSARVCLLRVRARRDGHRLPGRNRGMAALVIKLLTILHVPDPDAERRFYERLGLRTTYELRIPGLIAVGNDVVEFGLSRRPGPAAGLLAVVLIADRVAVIHAQDRVAARLEDRGFPAKPGVTIAGFPFLAQLAARRLKKVVISGVGKKLGPVEVKRLDVTVHGIRVSSSHHGRTASRLSGTALVGFAGLAGVSGTPGVTVCAGGPDRVKITVGLGLVTGTATARVTRAGPGGISIAVIFAGGIPVAALGPLREITLPLGMTIQGVSVTGQGVLVHIAGQNVSFSR